MTSVEIGLAMLAFMMVLLALRVHIGISMFLAGAVGYVWITGLNPLLSVLKHAPFSCAFQGGKLVCGALAWRYGDGRCGCVCQLWRNLWFIAGDRGNHDPGRIA